MSMRRATFGASPRGGHRRRARSGSCRRTGTRRRARPPAGEVEHVVARPRRPGRDVRAVVGGAQPSSAAIVGATSTSRPARGTDAVGAHALAARSTNGARACTTPSEPCSPRWPPWSSQLCAAEWITHRSGAAGWSKSCATCSYANGYALRRAGGSAGAQLGVEADERVRRLVGEGVGALAAPSARSAAYSVRRKRDPAAGARAPRSVASRAGGTMSTMGVERAESSTGSSTRHRSASPTRRSAVTSWHVATGAVDGRLRRGRLRSAPARLSRSSRRIGVTSFFPVRYIHAPSPADITRALARHRRRRRRARPAADRGRRRCCAASTSRSGRRTSTSATT